jgi:hypothetical protein
MSNFIKYKLNSLTPVSVSPTLRILADAIFCVIPAVSKLLRLAACSKILIASSSLPTASNHRGDSGRTLKQSDH